MKGGHKQHHHGRKKGGRIGDRVEVEGLQAGEGGGDPFVEEEAEEKKKGGRAKRKHGGHVDGKKGGHRMDHKRATGGAVARATGGGISSPGRKRGGRVGADTSPLSSAHNTASSSGGPKEQEGGLSK